MFVFKCTQFKLRAEDNHNQHSKVLRITLESQKRICGEIWSVDDLITDYLEPTFPFLHLRSSRLPLLAPEPAHSGEIRSKPSGTV